jgi:adenylate kinase
MKYAEIREYSSLSSNSLNNNEETTHTYKHTNINMIVLVTGVPGIGKGTQCKTLADNALSSPFTFIHISSGDLLRSEQEKDTVLGRYIKNNWSYHKLSDIVLALIKQTIQSYEQQQKVQQQDSKPIVYLLDATPRTLKDATAFDQMLTIDLVVSFETEDDGFLVNRLKGRLVHVASGRTYHETLNPPKEFMKDDVTGEPLVKRDDDTMKALQARIEKYTYQTQPLIDSYYQSSSRHNFQRLYVTSMSTIEDVQKQFVNMIETTYSTVKDNYTDPIKSKSPVEAYSGFTEVQFFDPLYDAIIQKMVTLSKSKHQNKFPGTNVIPLTKDHIRTIIKPNDNKYKAFAKLDGVRYFMLIMKNDNQVYLIDRALNIFNCTRAMRSGVVSAVSKSGDSLLDGEFLNVTIDESNRQPLFVVLDTLFVNGKNTRFTKNLESRLNAAISLSDQFFVRTNATTVAHDLEQYINSSSNRNDNKDMYLDICIQKKFNLQNLKELVQFCHTLESNGIGTDGIIFSKNDDPYILGLTKSSFKWKPFDKMTIDFQLQFNMDTNHYDLITWNDNQQQFEVYDQLADTTTDYSHMNGMIVECIYDPEAVTTIINYDDSSTTSNTSQQSKKRKRQQPDTTTKKRKGGWRIVHSRSDKTTPNPLWCVTKFVNDMDSQYAKTEQELCSLVLNK